LKREREVDAEAEAGASISGTCKLCGYRCARIILFSEKGDAVAKLELQSVIRKDEGKHIVVRVFDILGRHDQRMGIAPVVVTADGGSHGGATAQRHQTVARLCPVRGPCCRTALE